MIKYVGSCLNTGKPVAFVNVKKQVPFIKNDLE